MRRRAFTLIELMIVMAILSIVLAGVFDVLRLSSTGVARGDAEASMAQELELVVSRVRADLRAAYIDAESGRAIEIGAGGLGMTFPRALAGGGAGRPGLAECRWSFDAASNPPRLLRRLGPLPGGGSPPGTGTTEQVVSVALTSARFTLYTCRLEAPMLDYSTRMHAAYAPLLVRIELGARVGELTRELVTSAALQPYSRRQLDPYWNPVSVP
ncbi:MAG: type II secretion system protein [Candidatus Wallbacteria bacterium]|nr:type II secretion system protein [Candidatus Wallbacteria bacterium]MBI4867743.1 type II secretion system protein [Candidatus Wallbacteria bacterium]